MSSKISLKQVKELTSKSTELSAMNNYGDKILKKKQRSETLNSKIVNMENREQELLQRLHETQNNQRKAYTSLENMVNVGYNYYQQSYELKRKKQSELYPI